MLLIIGCTVLCVVVYALSNSRQNRSRNPPGPKPLPLIGNVFDFPHKNSWLTYTDWKKRYGDVAYMNVLGTPMVILNSLKACTELLEKRSAKYSGRPRFVMLTELMGWEYNFGLMSYTSRWRSHRRLFHQYFNQHAVANHLPAQQRSVHHFLQHLLAKPDSFLDHIRLYFGETILDLAYDIKVKDRNSIFIQNAEQAMHSGLLAGVPGRFLADVFPVLKYIPSWFPGAGFKKQATEWKKAILATRDLPFAYVKKEMENGEAGPSFLSAMLEICHDLVAKGNSLEGKALEETSKNCAAAIYAAGADTTLSTIQALFMALANNPEIQQAAQVEIDTLLGDGRLPNFEDMPYLPVVTAVCKELLRWHNVAPMGLAHSLIEDDEYDGYILRKGTIVLGNVWHILHDPDVYPEPLKFNPRRWLMETPEGLKINTSLPDPSIAVFGFGRRICPGRHFATNSVFITVASVLACFDIRPLDANGKASERVEELFTDGLISYPVPYKVSITPRSRRKAQLINDQD